MSFLDQLRQLVAATRAKSKAKKSAALAALLNGINEQLAVATDELEQIVTKEAQTKANGYLDITLHNDQGKVLETRPGDIDADDIKTLPAFLELQSKVTSLGLAMHLSEDLIHTQVEVENDNLAFRQWRVRINGWG